MRLDNSNDINHSHCYESHNKDTFNNFFLSHNKLSMQEEFSYHEHDLYEIYYHICGTVKFYITGKGHALSCGDIIVVRPGEIHRPVNDSRKDYEMVIILISKPFLDALRENHPKLDTLFEPVSKNGSLYIPTKEDLVQNINLTISKLEKSMVQTNKQKSSTFKTAHFLELLFLINNMLDKESTYSPAISPNEKVQCVIEYINDNITKNLSLDFLSELFYISKYHLSREFSKHVGCTLHQYILQRRLRLAKNLIDENNTLNGISERCGFDNYVTFLLAFKKNFGITPKDYLNQLNM